MSSRSSRSFCFIFFRMVRRPMVPEAPSRPLFLPGPGTPLLAPIGYHAHREHSLLASRAARAPLAAMGASALPPAVTLRTPRAPPFLPPQDPSLRWGRKHEVPGFVLAAWRVTDSPGLLTSSSRGQCKALFPRNVVQTFLILGLWRHPEPASYRASPFPGTCNRGG